MSILFDEIHQQPACLRQLAGNDPIIDAIVAAVRQRDARYVMLAARGTSDNAATYGKYLFQIVAGLPAGLAAPSVHTLYDAPVDYRGALVIGISQSGAGADITEVIVQARRRGAAATVAITNTAGSPLAEAAEFTLTCNTGVERAIAATKTYTTSLWLLARLIARLAKRDDLREKLDKIGDTGEAYLKVLEGRIAPLAATLIHAERLLTVARGLHLPTAIEASLKLAETTTATTQAFSSADLLHGPIASVPPRTPCLLFAPAGRTTANLVELAGKLRERGARVLTFGAPLTNPDIPLADPGDELLAPLLDILPAQLLAYYLTVARGLDPDSPRGLTKVTSTR